MTALGEPHSIQLNYRSSGTYITFGSIARQSLTKYYSFSTGGLEKMCLRFFVHAKMERATHDRIGGVEYDRGTVDFNLLGQQLPNGPVR